MKPQAPRRPRYYTGIGSRDSPAAVLELMVDLASALAAKGWHLRSGGADGADDAFERGALSASGTMSIYLPWPGFNGRTHSQARCVQARLREAEAIAARVHPAWEQCSPAARRLHARNAFQVLGDDLATPSRFLVCYAKPKGAGVNGGTNTAYMLAHERDIPCFNLFFEADLERVRKFARSRPATSSPCFSG